jgi:hypothetical protein
MISMRKPLFLRYSAVWIMAAAWLSPRLSACASCYGDPSSPVIKSVNLGIWLLLAVTGTVLFGIAAFAWKIGRRSGAASAAGH